MTCSSDTSVPAKSISATKIVVQDGRLVCEVIIPDPAKRYCTPRLAGRVRTVFPDIVKHACVNGVSDKFVTVMDSTSVPHLLEHLMIDIQVHDDRAEADASFVGATEWLDESAGTALLQVSFDDDLCALQALNESLDFLNAELSR